MKFYYFVETIKKYKKLLENSEKEEANKLLTELNLTNKDLKRIFTVKKYRVEKVIENYFESQGFAVRYEMNINNRSGINTVNLSNGESYLLKFNLKKGLGYATLNCLYKEVDNIELGLLNLITKYPDIEDGLWLAVKDSNNERKRRELFSVNRQIMNKQEEYEKSGKSDNLILKAIERLKQQKEEITLSLEDIELGTGI